MQNEKSLLYTATGDKGTTSLVGGSRAGKDDPRIEAYGTVDELNSHIGLLSSMLPAAAAFAAISRMLTRVQHQLFNIGAALANPAPEAPNPISHEEIRRIEHQIDDVDSQLPPLKQFILPGGTMAASQAHIARTVARRAERRIVALSHLHPVASNILIYINRLSDLLFAIARFNNIKTSSDEIFWQKDC